jgi:hypothetical protein
MNVSSVSSAHVAAQTAAAAQPKPADQPNDGDSDDKAASAVAFKAPGTGQVIDKKA